MRKLLVVLIAAAVIISFSNLNVQAAPVTLIDQQAMWEYSVLQSDLWPIWGSVNYTSVIWDTLDWSNGRAAFGNPYSLPYNTTWAANTDLALQKPFFVDGILSMPITLNVASDNGFVVFINGHQVAKENAEGYTTYWEYSIPLTTLGFISPGENLIQVLAEDHGGATFFDMKLTGDVSPVPEPTTMLLLASGLIGLAGLRRKFHKN